MNINYYEKKKLFC